MLLNESKVNESRASAIAASSVRCPFCAALVKAGRPAFIEVGQYDEDEQHFDIEGDVLEYVCTENASHIFYAFAASGR